MKDGGTWERNGSKNNVQMTSSQSPNLGKHETEDKSQVIKTILREVADKCLVTATSSRGFVVTRSAIIKTFFSIMLTTSKV